MSSAKQAVDSTIKRVLIHMAEIIASIILLVIISLPLIFVIPMWFQEVAFGTTIANLAVNPVTWFGLFGAVGVTALIAIVSLIIGYAYVMGMSHRIEVKKTRPKKVSEPEPAESETPVEDALDEEVPAEPSDDDVVEESSTDTSD
ncbi:MAG: hypothetical protein K9W43_03330 [Candidatus Thorarchaeota archaeon]|nr:hypothetical protein [Candidatus Thorarchaeota archaeon]